MLPKRFLFNRHTTLTPLDGTSCLVRSFECRVQRASCTNDRYRESSSTPDNRSWQGTVAKVRLEN